MRNRATKTNVIIDIDQVRPINKRDQIPVAIPTSDGMEDWI
jgi:hypothetical protein